MKPSYEDIIFYLDIAKDMFKKKYVIKAIKNFISEKNKTNLKGHYGLLIFQEEGNPIFIIDKKDSTIIANAIEENWKNRPRDKSFFENGLFYIFSYIAETIRKRSKRNRIIIITDTPSDLSEDYTEALFNLVSKIKSFPTIIDIVRISPEAERLFKDDVKLNILVTDTKGDIFYVHDKKEFFIVFEKLVKPKRSIDFLRRTEETLKIDEEDYEFYSRLAKELKPTSKQKTGVKCIFCQEEICPVCNDIYDIPLKCENCGTTFHYCCITNYSIQNNIGIPHIFRCPGPKCDILLKIRQEEIVEIEDKKKKLEPRGSSEIMKETAKNLINTNLERETPDLRTAKTAVSKNVEFSQDKEKFIKVGGYFGKYYTVRKEGNKLVFRKISSNSPQKFKENTNQQKKERINKTLKPLSNRKLPNSVFKGDLVICPECGTHLDPRESENNQCPYCGHKF